MDSSSRAPRLRKKNGKGRAKIIMKRIAKKTDLQVSFSKRHNGVMKKASELVTLTGCKIGIIMFSPGKKVISFGHPSVETIMDDYFPKQDEEETSNALLMAPSSDERMEIEAGKRARALERNIQLLELEKETEREMEKKVVFEEMWKEAMEAQSIPVVNDMMEPELMELRGRLNELKEMVIVRMKSMIHEATNYPDYLMSHVPMEIGHPNVNPMEGFTYDSYN